MDPLPDYRGNVVDAMSANHVDLLLNMCKTINNLHARINYIDDVIKRLEEAFTGHTEDNEDNWGY